MCSVSGRQRISDRKTEDGLRTIFELFIDNPKASTISVDTFKKICKEIGETLTDEELRRVEEDLPIEEETSWLQDTGEEAGSICTARSSLVF